MIDVDADERRWSQFMAAAHRGDSRLYERLLGELASVIAAYVRSRFGALFYAEDCVQECLIAIHNARHTYDPKRPFRPWLFAIVRNRTVDLLRRSYASDRVREIAGDLHRVAPDPRAELEAGEIFVGLKPEFSRALILTKILGCSINEAAQRSGISATAMKSRVSRAIRAAELLIHAERSNE
ncbi:MAG: sigma-70 family RNA polymerase sigma factor [Gammaproteobacteria bacterium]